MLKKRPASDRGEGDHGWLPVSTGCADEAGARLSYQQVNERKRDSPNRTP